MDLHDERMVKSGYSFHNVGDEQLPFEDDMLDVVLSNHIIEHMPNQESHISEIKDFLR